MRAAATLAEQITAHGLLAQAMERTHAGIPVLVVAFNNGRYVDNMVMQLNAYHIQPLVIDNCSTDPKTKAILERLAQEQRALVAWSPRNLGHLVGFLDPVYRLLPDVFGYTDPDLQFHKAMPPDFLSQLAAVVQRYRVFKAGLALSLDAGQLRPMRASTRRRYPFKYEQSSTIREWECQYWTCRLLHETLEVYAAPVDTTMAVYQKKYFKGDFAQAVRVAGVFTAVHLPWFEDLDIVSVAERELYRKTNRFSAWLRNGQACEGKD